MTNTPTAHNSAKTGDFAKTVLMPGDPLRAKYIAETYLENPRQVTHVVSAGAGLKKTKSLWGRKGEGKL